MKYFTLLLLLIAASTFAAQDPTISRGPYLQVGTDTSMIIRWRTSYAYKCRLTYGTALNQQTQTVTETTSGTEHEIFIGGLQPFTRYYYSIYRDTSGTPLASDSTYHFITNPVAGTVQPIHLWVTGDMGNGSQQQLDVRDRYWNHVRNGRHCDSWLWLGDNVYSDGTDLEYQMKLFQIYPEILRNTVSRACPGNHDYGAIDPFTHDGPYYQNFTLPKKGEAGGKPSNEEGYYSYDYGNVHFVSLNSEVALWYALSGSQMNNWLKQDLAATTQPWKIVYWHKPPYTKGSHDSDDATDCGLMRGVVVPILEQYGVDLVLTGHSHNYERSYPIHGHYGTSGDFNFTHQVSTTSGKASLNEAYTKYTTGPDANKGTLYIVCGNGGQKTSGKDLNHPIMYFSEQDVAGFMTIDINDMTLTGNYYDAAGNKKDDFTINKVAATGIQSGQGQIKNLKLYPNPTTNQLQLELSLAESQQIKVEIFDVAGKLVGEPTSQLTPAGDTKMSISTVQMPAGKYYVKLTGDKIGEIQLVTVER